MNETRSGSCKTGETISALQSAIALNRQEINKLHEEVVEWKERMSRDAEWLALREGYRICVKEDSKKIAQLVRIQKMLKKQLAKEIAEEKQKRNFDKFWEELESD